MCYGTEPTPAATPQLSSPDPSVRRVAQVGVGIDAAAAATLDNGVEDGAALAGISIAQEQPVLFSKSGRPNAVFHEVVVYLDSAVFEIDTKQRPVGESVIDGLTKSPAGQIAAGLFEEDQSAVQTLTDRTTLAHAHSGAFPWTRRAGPPRCGRDARSGVGSIRNAAGPARAPRRSCAVRFDAKHQTSPRCRVVGDDWISRIRIWKIAAASAGRSELFDGKGATNSKAKRPCTYAGLTTTHKLHVCKD